MLIVFCVERPSEEVPPLGGGISTKHPKAELKDFTVIDTDSNNLYHQAEEALHIHCKGPSLSRSIGKVRIPLVFNKLLKCHMELEQPHSSVPH